MPELHYFLQDMGVIFLLSMGVILICFRVRIPPIIGFLVTGMLAGPAGLGLVDDLHVVEMMAEIGIVLLLFTIGIEFSLKELWKIRRPVFLGGSSQALLTLSAGAGLAWMAGFPLKGALFCGFLLTLSSTAIVLKLMQERGEMNAPQGGLSLAILIFQDMAAIPMMLMIPFLAGVQSSTPISGGMLALKIVGAIGGTILLTRFVVPWILKQVVTTRIRELFLISVVGICVVVAWISASIGLSLALGAFIAGLIISESEYSHQALGDILPFKDIFTSLFFVSTGMLLSFQSLWTNGPTLIWLLPLLLVIKIAIIIVSGLLSGSSLRVSVMVAFMLAQIGEFALVVGKLGFQSDLFTEAQYQLFLSVAILSMVLTPPLFWLAKHVSQRMPLTEKAEEMTEDISGNAKLIIIGYGVGGRNLAHSAKRFNIPYRILEANLRTVTDEREKGVAIYYGDATKAEVIEHIGIQHAQALSIMISDPAAARRIVELARRLYPHLWIAVRTRLVVEIDSLYQLGANRVITEEFESSIEMFSQVLGRFMVPYYKIRRIAQQIRSEQYGLFREHSDQPEFSDLFLKRMSDLELASFKVPKHSKLHLTQLKDSRIRQDFKLNVLAVERNGVSNTQIEPEFQLHKGDVLVVIGRQEDVDGFGEYLQELV